MINRLSFTPAMARAFVAADEAKNNQMHEPWKAPIMSHLVGICQFIKEGSGLDLRPEIRAGNWNARYPLLRLVDNKGTEWVSVLVMMEYLPGLRGSPNWPHMLEIALKDEEGVFQPDLGCRFEFGRFGIRMPSADLRAIAEHLKKR